MSGLHDLQTSFWLACDALIWRHCAPWELDEALVTWGYGLGPCEAQDMVGLDRVLAARGGSGSPVLARMVTEGRLGKAAGWGYYRYPGGGGAVVDPLLEDLVSEEAWLAKVTRDEVAGDQLVARVHALMRDEMQRDLLAAARVLHVPIERLALI